MKTKEHYIEYFKSLEKENYDNSNVGGGINKGLRLDSGDYTGSKYVSNRQADAQSDESKLTIGEAGKILKKFYPEYDKNIVMDTFNLEWHHSGHFKSKYGSQMSKTYFVNATQMVDLLNNYKDYEKEYHHSKQLEQQKRDLEHNKDKQRNLIKNKYPYEKFNEAPLFGIGEYYMKGKYGEFPADYKYNLPTFWKGYKLSEEDYFLYVNIGINNEPEKTQKFGLGDIVSFPIDSTIKDKYINAANEQGLLKDKSIHGTVTGIDNNIHFVTTPTINIAVDTAKSTISKSTPNELREFSNVINSVKKELDDVIKKEKTENKNANLKEKNVSNKISIKF